MTQINAVNIIILCLGSATVVGKSPVSLGLFFKGYSLMVEQWSSKSSAWVRFLLPLLFYYLSF